MNHDHPFLRIFYAWLMVGLSQMSPLQWVQMIAAAAATIYSLAMLFFLLRDKWWRERKQ